MIRFSRSLATRLRRAAFPAPRPLVATAPADVWGRFQAALEAPEARADIVRERELAEENLRLAVTLLGQQGARAMSRMLAVCDGEVESAGPALRVALSLAEAVGLAV